jgi:hypothetical protein
MNCRKAAEDFYFLQKLAKIDGVGSLTGTTVFPESRVSSRVPFGTGRSMARMLDGDTRAVLFYPAAAFRMLAEWLRTADQQLSGDAGQLLMNAEKISPVLSDYLEKSDWLTVWPRLQSTHQDPGRRKRAFHSWFDGFRTMRLVHLFCDAGFGRGEPEDVLPAYFAWDGRANPGSLTAMLEAMRLHDGTKNNQADDKHVENLKSCAIVDSNDSDRTICMVRRKADDECS